MNAIEVLERKVRELYEARDSGRDDWADWMYEHHVFAVTRYATELASRVGAKVVLARAAAMLHDIADARMKRENPRHEEESLSMARRLLQDCGFGAQDVGVVVDDAIRWHSCHDGRAPGSVEGKVLATADALAHLKTDFYVYGTWVLSKRMTFDRVKSRALEKIERDFKDKIQFEDVREGARRDYEMLRGFFSR